VKIRETKMKEKQTDRDLWEMKKNLNTQKKKIKTKRTAPAGGYAGYESPLKHRNKHYLRRKSSLIRKVGSPVQPILGVQRGSKGTIGNNNNNFPAQTDQFFSPKAEIMQMIRGQSYGINRNNIGKMDYQIRPSNLTSSNG
jgi:hypothetical protein